jgi:hypothetical protein
MLAKKLNCCGFSCILQNKTSAIQLRFCPYFVTTLMNIRVFDFNN